jgi:hypothetical protein
MIKVYAYVSKWAGLASKRKRQLSPILDVTHYIFLAPIPRVCMGALQLRLFILRSLRLQLSLTSQRISGYKRANGRA